ncbi:MAG: hypothetical protein WC824_15930 [Bacteroidota bacterium]|jgi:hypothetical protein
MENTVKPEEAVQLLEKKFSDVRGRLTVSDAAAATGFPIESTRDALEVLMNKYVCRLQVTEHGEVLYDFGSNLRRRGAKTFREHVRTVGNFLWKTFTVGFKIWITVTLVVYFIIFVLLLLALIFSGRDSKKSVKLSWFGDLFADLFWVSSRHMAITSVMDGGGYRHKAYRQKMRRSGELEKQKRLVQSVYDFVFGPARPNYDPFSNEKEVAAWLRENKGVLTMTELVALAGWTYEQASERMADYLTRFKGDATITDDGVLIGDFQNMLAAGEAQLDGGKVELYWDEFEAPYEMSGNTAGKNAAIIGVNAFNLAIAGLILTSPSLRMELEYLLYDFGVGSGAIFTLLGMIPLLFSMLFFAVPLLRFLPTKRRESARRKRNEHRRVLRHIFSRSGCAVSLAKLCEDVNSDSSRKLSEDELRNIVEQLMPIYGGRSELAEDGTVLYIFDRIGREETAAKHVRSQRDPGHHPGDIIFDTAGPKV